MFLMSLRLNIEDDEGATPIVTTGNDTRTIGLARLNSYSGVKVNDRSVEGRMGLRECDIVQIGDYHLAITEDVDKSTLNYDRPGRAANDPTGEPLLASSSADLPRLSPEEIHALQSG